MGAVVRRRWRDIRLREKDIKLAKSRQFLNPLLGRGAEGYRQPVVMTPQALHDYCKDQLKELGYKFVHKKGPKSWKWKRFTTTMRRRIYLGVGWSQKSLRQRAAILAHELVHALQWRGLKRFGRNYVFSARFRWAVETQAYRESCRAYRAMGLAEAAVQEYASAVPARLIKGYAILNKRLRKDIHRVMPDIIAAA